MSVQNVNKTIKNIFKKIIVLKNANLTIIKIIINAWNAKKIVDYAKNILHVLNAKNKPWKL